MEASTVFKDILNKVETSQLNYVISKTPFSANIVIKSSFIKYYDARSSTDPIMKDESEKKSFQNVKITSDLVSLKKQIVRLEDLLQSERNRVKSLEDQIGEFRGKLLDIKKEKSDLNSQLKAHKTQLTDLKSKNMKIHETNKDLEVQLALKNENLNLKQNETKVINEEKESLKTKLDQCLSEIDSFKLERNLKKQVILECNLCDMICESAVDLSQHVRAKHVKHQVSQTRIQDVAVSTQTEEILEITETEYPCFYCGQIINSSGFNLARHLSECSELGLLDEDTNNEPKTPTEPYFPPSPPLPPLLFPPPLFPPHPFSPLVGFQKQVPCYRCDENFPHEVVLKRHYEEVHPEIILFWCNVCWTNFGSERGLQSHERNEHK